jgi:hypothetical protein
VTLATPTPSRAVENLAMPFIEVAFWALTLLGHGIEIAFHVAVFLGESLCEYIVGGVLEAVVSDPDED